MRHLLLLLCFFSSHLYGQKAPIKWKEVPMDDLQMKSYPLDSSASAVVLCDYGFYEFETAPNGRNLFLFNNRHVRIKILKPEGLKYAKVNIPFTDWMCEKVSNINYLFIKGMTYNLSKNGEMKVSKLKRKKIDYKDTSKCKKVASFILPDVKVGSVIDYYYSEPTLDFLSPQSWNFQWEIPVRHSEFRMRTPRYFRYMFSSVNFDNFDFAEETNYSKTLLVNLGNSVYRRSYGFDVSGTQIQLINYNLEAFAEHAFLFEPETQIKKLDIHLVRALNKIQGRAWQYITHALFTTLVEGYENYQPIHKSSIMYPAGFILYDLPDWERVNEDLLKSHRFGLPLIKHWEYQPYLDSIIKGKKNKDEKMLAIYDYIRKNIKWNGKGGIYVRSVFSPGLSKVYTKVTKKLLKEKSLKRPFENKEGSSSEINMILLSLLNKAGIEAHPVLIKKREKGQIDIDAPDPRQFNHVLAMAKTESGDFLLDAIDSLRPCNLLNVSDIGQDGFLVHRKDFGWIKVENVEQTSTNVHETIEIDNAFHLKQQLTIKQNGYDALETRKSILNSGSAEGIGHIDVFIGQNRIDTIINLNDDKAPLILKAMVNNSQVADRVIIRPKFDPAYTQKDFTNFYRKHPIEFDFPFSKSYLLEIQVPEGVECILPKSASSSTYGGNINYNYEVIKLPNKIQLQIKLDVQKLVFPAIEYGNIAQLFTELNELLNEPIVVLRKGS